MSWCGELWRRLAEACCVPAATSPTDECTHLTVKCQNRYASDDNLLTAGWPGPGEVTCCGGTPSEPQWRPLTSAARLSMSEAHLDRVQPPTARMYRPDLAASSQSLYPLPDGASSTSSRSPSPQPGTYSGQRSELTISRARLRPAPELDVSSESVSVAGSAPDITSQSQSKLTFVSRRFGPRRRVAEESTLRPALLRHACTIADVTQLPLRQLKKQNRPRVGDGPAASQPGAAADEKDDASASDEEFGTVSVTVSCSAHRRQLTVSIDGASELAARGGGDVPYRAAAELAVLPSGPTRRVEATTADLSPQFSAEWQLPLPARGKQLAAGTLRVTLLDADRTGRDAPVGHALLPLREMLRYTTPQQLQLPLLRHQQLPRSLGQLLVTLHYTQERLSVEAVRGRELCWQGSEKRARPHTLVKVTLRCAGQKIVTRRSPAVAVDQEPRYSTRFQFVLPRAWADDASVVLTVTHRGPLRSEAKLGRTQLGPQLRHRRAALTHWGRALTTGQVVTQWHRLWL